MRDELGMSESRPLVITFLVDHQGETHESKVAILKGFILRCN